MARAVAALVALTSLLVSAIPEEAEAQARQRAMGRLPDGRYYVLDEVLVGVDEAFADRLSRRRGPQGRMDTADVKRLHPRVREVRPGNRAAREWQEGRSIPRHLRRKAGVTPPIARRFKLKLQQGANARDLIDQIASEEGVDWADLNYAYEPLGQPSAATCSADDACVLSCPIQPDPDCPNDPDYASQWGPERIGAEWAWNRVGVDLDVQVAIVDTGVDLDHPDLENRITGSFACDDNPNGDAPHDGMAKADHGTHVAGIVAAEMDDATGMAGVAQVGIMAMGCSCWNADELQYFICDAPGAINDAVTNGADVINASFGQSADMGSAMRSALNNARDNGVIVVAAAGNDSMDVTDIEWDDHDWPIIVSSTTSSDALSSFSNTGSIDLAAPGSSVYSTSVGTMGSTYATKSGTSMAAPHVAGVVAQILAARQSYDRDSIYRLLELSAEDLGTAGWDTSFGHGLVRVDRAVRMMADTYVEQGASCSGARGTLERPECTLGNGLNDVPSGGAIGLVGGQYSGTSDFTTPLTVKLAGDSPATLSGP